MNNIKIGASLAKQSPWGLVITSLVFIVLFLNTPINMSNSYYSLTCGLITGATLLSYWHGKGGIFFIVAILMPLVLIVLSDLPTFFALAWVINGFFFGLALLLFCYHIYLSYVVEPSE